MIIGVFASKGRFSSVLTVPLTVRRLLPGKILCMKTKHAIQSLMRAGKALAYWSKEFVKASEEIERHVQRSATAESSQKHDQPEKKVPPRKERKSPLRWLGALFEYPG